VQYVKKICLPCKILTKTVHMAGVICLFLTSMLRSVVTSVVD